VICIPTEHADLSNNIYVSEFFRTSTGSHAVFTQLFGALRRPSTTSSIFFSPAQTSVFLIRRFSFIMNNRAQLTQCYWIERKADGLQWNTALISCSNYVFWTVIRLSTHVCPCLSEPIRRIRTSHRKGSQWCQYIFPPISDLHSSLKKTRPSPSHSFLFHRIRLFSRTIRR
jgi:hypothetical protein